MAELASEILDGSRGKVIQTSMEEWEYPEDSFDLVISRLAVHYIEDIGSLFSKQWLGGTVYKYHRTIENYYSALQQAGFAVHNLRESNPQRKYFISEETYERRRRIPLFLFLAAQRVIN